MHNTASSLRRVRCGCREKRRLHMTMGGVFCLLLHSLTLGLSRFCGKRTRGRGSASFSLLLHPAAAFCQGFCFQFWTESRNCGTEKCPVHPGRIVSLGWRKSVSGQSEPVLCPRRSGTANLFGTVSHDAKRRLAPPPLLGHFLLGEVYLCCIAIPIFLLHLTDPSESSSWV